MINLDTGMEAYAGALRAFGFTIGTTNEGQQVTVSMEIKPFFTEKGRFFCSKPNVFPGAASSPDEGRADNAGDARAYAAERGEELCARRYDHNPQPSRAHAARTRAGAGAGTG